MQARSLPARHGALWFFAGFQLFRRNPPLLTALTLAYYFFCAVIIFLSVSIAPLVLLLPVILPTLTVVIANGCRTLDQGLPQSKLDLAYGIQTNRKNLIRLGGLHLLSFLVVLTISMAVEGGPKELLALKQAGQGEMLGMLARLLLIASPVLMAFWFAPLLTAWNDVPALKSVFFSFVASLRNWRAFVAYLIVVGVIVELIPRLILLAAKAISPTFGDILSVAIDMILTFIAAPILMASVYISYRDVFQAVDEHA